MYESEIAEIYQKCNIRDFPIDCCAVVKALGFTLVSYGDLAESHAEYKRLCLYSSDAFTACGDMMICYNHKNSPRRIRFSLMHELGHYVLDTGDEDKADAFASNILAPPAVIIERRLNSAEKISSFFDMSIAASNHALISSLGYDVAAGAPIMMYFNSLRYESVLNRPRPARRKKSSLEQFYNERSIWLSQNYPHFNDLAFVKRDYDLLYQV